MSTWRKSTRSFSNGNCAEVASWWRAPAPMSNGQCGGIVGVRDSRLGERSPVLAFPAAAWREFAGRVKRDEGAAY